MKHRNAWLLVSSAAIMTVGFWGCGDDTGSGGAGGSDTTTNTTVATNATKTTGVTTPASTGTGMVEFVGRECGGDGECGPMGKCILPTANDPVIGNGGPANGYCTIPCMNSSECPNNGICFTVEEGQEGECFLGCEIGPDLMYVDDPLDDNKCHGREDLRCQEYDAGSACIPTCGSDAQCPAGRSCDPRLAICVDTPNTGEDTGFKCTQNADPPECAGVCVGFGSDITMCSNRCVMGGELLDTYDCGGIENGICAFSPSGYGPGDAGFCSPACNFHSDCQNPDFWCFSTNFTTNGFCFGGVDPCPNGQGDCDPADACTDTPYGPLCLDPIFPLDDQGTGGGGGGVGGAGGGGVGGAGGAGGN